jgi:hypothetical protein
VTAGISIVVPWRPDGAFRDVAWELVRHKWAREFPGAEIIEGSCPPGRPWSKGTAVANALTEASGDVIVVADADVWCEAVRPSIEVVRAGAPWAMPHLRVYRLTRPATIKVLAGGPIGGDVGESHRGVLGGGIVVVARDVIDSVPMDPRFHGWGQEDTAWAMALHVIAGEVVRGKAPLWHLWHPEPPRLTRTRGSQESCELHARYKDARFDRAAMVALISGIGDDPESGEVTAPRPIVRKIPVLWKYRNRNSGQEVCFSQRKPRLDRLPNWELLEFPDRSDCTVAVKPQPHQSPAPPVVEDAPTVVAEPEPDPGPALVVEASAPAALRPRPAAPKAEWSAYAATRGIATDGMTKAQIVTACR